jgi:1,4-alpha-glucan branching enzyme
LNEVRGYLSVVLHAHLPFVHHPEYPDFLEEDWLFEAITECYLPLLRMMTRLWRDNVQFRLTMSITPPLCEMLSNPLLQERYAAKVESLRKLAHQQVVASQGTAFEAVSLMYADDLDGCAIAFNQAWGRDLLGAFKLFQDRGCLEIITCGATHGLLPLMATDTARRAQIEVAVTNYRKHFGRAPRGIWLPECAYTPALEPLLKAAGLRFFFLEKHGLTQARPAARLGTARPVYTPLGLAAFGRDARTSHQVWSAADGYPGDPAYREFYRDLGYDLPYEEVKPYLHDDGVRRNVGIKFHRITGRVDLGQKKPYVPAWARERAEAHAADFLRRSEIYAAEVQRSTGLTPHITTPYDAELFGHWWFEGPYFLEMFLRAAAAPDSTIALTTPAEYLQASPRLQVVSPAMSSWGDGGYFKVWLNAKNDWIYKHLHEAEARMIALARRFPNASGLLKRALTQAARELLLAQSSDWAFIITMDTSVPYAEKRTRDHVHRFTALYDQILAGEIDLPSLTDWEAQDCIFPELDYRTYIDVED